MTNEKMMSYLVNVDVKIPKAIFDALVLHETYCVGLGIEYVTEQEVKDFLLKRFNKKMADNFKSQYLYLQKI